MSCTVIKLFHIYIYYKREFGIKEVNNFLDYLNGIIYLAHDHSILKLLISDHNQQIFILLVSNDWKKHSRMKYEPHAHKDMGFTKKTKTSLKKTPFRRVPTAPKCCKNNMKSRFSPCVTKTWPKITPTRQMLITIRGLQKHLPIVKKTPFQQMLTAQKCCKKQYRINIFVLSDQKMHSCAKC